jgi:hypothetical protein
MLSVSILNATVASVFVLSVIILSVAVPFPGYESVCFACVR